MVTSKSAHVKKINLTYFGKFCQLDRAVRTLLPPRPGQSHCWQQQSPGDPRDGTGRICARGDVLSSETPTRERQQRRPAQLRSTPTVTLHHPTPTGSQHGEEMRQVLAGPHEGCWHRRKARVSCEWYFWDRASCLP